MLKVKSEFVALALAASLIAAAGGQAVGQTKPEPATRPSSTTPTNPAGTSTEAVGAPVDPNKYLIGPEDVLFVKVWRENDFTLPVAVRPDGKITMPFNLFPNREYE